jgi:hypothetical protein
MPEPPTFSAEVLDMSRLVYACRLVVPAISTIDPILQRYTDWVERHYRDKHGKREFAFDVAHEGACPLHLPPDHTLEARQWRTEAGVVHSLLWRFPSDADASLYWRNEVKMLGGPTGARVEHLIWIEAVDFLISPATIALGSPGVIRRICSSWPVKVGDIEIRAQPRPFQAGGISELTSLLEDPNRRFPIVLVAPYTNGSDNLLDPEALARNLAGVALIVDAVDAKATWGMADKLGRTLSCFDGAARIYWPGFSRMSNPRRHPLYLAERIEAVGADRVQRAIERTIFSVASFRYAADPVISAIIKEAQDFQRRERVESQRVVGSLDWEAYALELDAALVRAGERLEILEAENANLRENQAVLFSVSEDGAIEPELEPASLLEPETVLQAVEMAQSKCRNLTILDSALKAAAKSPFRRPYDVLEALVDLDAIAGGWSKDDAGKKSGGDLVTELKKRGWGKRASQHLSKTTKAIHGEGHLEE